MNPIVEGRITYRKLVWTEGCLVETLSPRESEILQLVVDGLRYQQIADKLGISERTVRTHMHFVFSKLGVRHRVEAINLARRAGFVAVAEQPTTSRQAMAIAQRYLALAQTLAKEGK